MVTYRCIEFSINNIVRVCDYYLIIFTTQPMMIISVMVKFNKSVLII